MVDRHKISVSINEWVFSNRFVKLCTKCTHFYICYGLEKITRPIRAWGVFYDTLRYFGSPATQEIIDELLNHVSPQEYNLKEGDEFADETIVFTGSLPTYTRSEASDIVEREGDSVSSSVPSNTDLLVVGESPGQRKQSAAENNNIETISGDEFENLIERQTTRNTDRSVLANKVLYVLYCTKIFSTIPFLLLLDVEKRSFELV